MNIREYVLMKTEDNHPVLKVRREMEYETDTFDTPYEIATLMVGMYSMNELFIEYVYVLGFDFSNRLLGIVELGHQTDSETVTPIKEMFMSLLLMGANNFVLVHNHPNNALVVSPGDINLSSKILVNSNLLELKFRDSIIICDEDFISLKSEGVF